MKRNAEPILALAPMADMTDSAFCRVVKSLANPVVFREMVSSEALVRGNDKTLGMTDIHPDERPLIQQLFGSNPQTMADAAAWVEKTHHPDGFDINMGCPVYKITHHFNGAALMRDPELAAKIVREMKAAVSVPVSVKIRLGWSEKTECLAFAKVLEEAGADLITVHGRTKAQAYAGKADWDMIRRVKEAVSIPVLANGDIFSPELAIEAMTQTGCDGVAIARGALGNPWIFKQTEQLLRGETPMVVDAAERIRIVKMHLDLHLAQYGDRGIVTFRKHLAWYFKGTRGAKALRERLVRVETREELSGILDEMR